ncbi:MAG: riboflavin synthase [Proteobacteria bacterium]|nr:riboflavin synthase [Pseudomonadota bacterium]
MFTGIIEGMGAIREVSRSAAGMRVCVEAGFDLAGLSLGDSVAVSGACLTAVSIAGRVFCADVSPETFQRTTLAKARPGDPVNLERALSLSGRLDGHLVTGHVDAVGRVASVEKKANAILVSIQAPEPVMRYVVEKGSIAVDGVSLTVNQADGAGFSLAIIPHTAKLTTIGGKRPGDPVNLEADIIAKYVERFVNRAAGSPAKDTSGASGLSRDFLLKSGFL